MKGFILRAWIGNSSYIYGLFATRDAALESHQEYIESPGATDYDLWTIEKWIGEDRVNIERLEN